MGICFDGRQNRFISRQKIDAQPIALIFIPTRGVDCFVLGKFENSKRHEFCSID